MKPEHKHLRWLLMKRGKSFDDATKEVMSVVEATKKAHKLTKAKEKPKDRDTHHIFKKSKSEHIASAKGGKEFVKSK